MYVIAGVCCEYGVELYQISKIIYLDMVLTVDAFYFIRFCFGHHNPRVQSTILFQGGGWGVGSGE